MCSSATSAIKALVISNMRPLPGATPAKVRHLARPQQLRPLPSNRALAVLEGGERTRNLGDRLLGRLRIDDHDVGGIPRRKAVVGEIHHPCRARGQYLEAVAQTRGLVD